MREADSRREELEQYIASSRGVRKGALWVGAVGVGLALALLIGGAGTSVFLAVALVPVVIAGAGAWITWAHIQDFEKELDALRPRRRAHRSGGRHEIAGRT